MSDTEGHINSDLPQEETNTPPPVEDPPPQTPGLRRGDSSRGVFDLQLRLGCAGTGVYDEATEYAVKSMQAASGLTVDGVAGEQIHGRLGLSWPAAS
jgi:peptidoglycan hydrolase-like protein with peptidoglycan-binding domain